MAQEKGGAINPSMPNQWMPRKEWDALVRGENCPLCGLVKALGADNDSNYFVADLTISRLVLVNNQYVKGYCGLICHKHVREPYELPQDERELFFDDMMRAGMALENVYKADKMNFQILGNAVPHLHCHLEPRYYGDPSPNHPIDPEAATVVLKPEEYRKSVASIRHFLSLIK